MAKTRYSRQDIQADIKGSEGCNDYLDGINHALTALAKLKYNELYSK